jgi:hypothetical protein
LKLLPRPKRSKEVNDGRLWLSVAGVENTIIVPPFSPRAHLIFAHSQSLTTTE